MKPISGSRTPSKRAAYLCELRGAPIDAESNTAMPAAFLMEQMAWREALDDASTAAELDALQQQLDGARAGILGQLADLLDTVGDAAGAAQKVRALLFVERFGRDVEARMDQLGQ